MYECMIVIGSLSSKKDPANIARFPLIAGIGNFCIVENVDKLSTMCVDNSKLLRPVLKCCFCSFCIVESVDKLSTMCVDNF